MRSVVGKLAALAITTLLAGTAIVSCSSKSEQIPTGGTEDTKNVSLQLEIAPQANVDSVHYVVRNASGATVKEGDIPVPGGEETFIFGISLPVGGPYTIALSAGNATIECNGSTGPFSISSVTTANATATLVCRDISTGDVIVDVDVSTEACPALTMNYIVATPSSAPVDLLADPAGSQVAVLASSTDANGTTPAYAWTASPAGMGTFVAPGSQNTAFNCDAPGQVLLTVTSTITTTDGTCDDTLTVPVTCFPVNCGNGVIDPGEQCDGQPGCPSDCTVSCGDGVVEFGEQCEPPNSQTCTATCQTRIIACPNGFVDVGETCDDNNNIPNDGCTNCQTDPVVMARCGDAIIQSTTMPPEECESPTSVNPFNGNGSCSNDCQVAASAACFACESAGPCVDLTLGCATFPTAAGRTACYNLLECFRDNPSCGQFAPEPCYCGALDTGTCAARPPFPDPNAPNGPCARQFEAAMESNLPSTVLVNFSNLAVPGAHAVQRLLCDEALCTAECF